jgi:hypothetical protein
MDKRKRLCLIIDKCRRQKLCKRAQKISAAAPLRVMVISLRLGFRRNFLSVLHPNLVSSPIKGILEILNLTPPGAFRWIFWHGRIVSDQVQVRFHK